MQIVCSQVVNIVLRVRVPSEKPEIKFKQISFIALRDCCSSPNKLEPNSTNDIVISPENFKWAARAAIHDAFVSKLFSQLN